MISLIKPGKRFGRLKAINRCGTKETFVLWKCQCRCGNTHIVRSMSLNNGDTTSCGCYRSEQAAKTMKRNHSSHSKPKT